MGLLRAMSEAVDGLYRLAETASLDEFPAAVIGLLGQHIGFDGAVLGSADPLSLGDFSIAAAHVHNRDPSILDDYAALSAIDPVTQSFLEGVPRALAVDTEQLYADATHRSLLALSRKHRLRHLMLCGQPPSQTAGGRWVVLYRAEHQPFEPEAADRLSAFWVHMERAVALNRAHALEQVKPSQKKGLALLDENGRLEAVDELFVSMVYKECGIDVSHRLPEGISSILLRKHEYKGRQVLAKLVPLGRYWVCVLSDVGPLAQLSPREQLVAMRFAQGQTSKEIAQDMQVSQYTVQTQLASVYRKLGVSDKASLARLLAQVHHDHREG